nr:unnamed protein product [Digitaria exilis]
MEKGREKRAYPDGSQDPSGLCPDVPIRPPQEMGAGAPPCPPALLPPCPALPRGPVAEDQATRRLLGAPVGEDQATRKGRCAGRRGAAPATPPTRVACAYACESEEGSDARAVEPNRSIRWTER